MLQHAKHAGTRGSGGMPPPGKFLKIDAKILQHLHLYEMLLFCHIILLQRVLIERFLSAQTTT